MVTPTQRIIFGLVAMLFALLLSIYRYRVCDKAAKILTWLLALTIFNEILATYCAFEFHNSYVIYGIFNPIQLLLITMYFYYSTKELKRTIIIIYVGVALMLLGFINYFFIQTPQHMNNIFLLCESLSIITISMYAYYRMLIADDNLRLIYFPHFWFTSLFMFFWLATFLIWGIYDSMKDSIGITVDLMLATLLIVNVITYIGIGLVFLFYKRIIAANGW